MNSLSRRKKLTFVPLVALASALTLAACGSNSSDTVTVDISDGAPRGDSVAIPGGAIDKAINDLPGIVTDVMDRTKVPGVAVGVVRDGKTAFAEGYGVREVGEEGNVDKDTVFQIASISKSIGATVTATQVSKEVVDWDDPVKKYLPDFKLSDPWVTDHLLLSDLYSHRSGIPATMGDELEEIGFDRQAILQRLAQAPLNPFRITYGYSNFGITAAAEAVAKASGKSWEQLSQDEIYGPLEMTSTSSSYSDFIKRENKASLHAKTDDGFAALYKRNPDPQSPAGGVSSNVVDMSNWMQMLLANGSFGDKQIASSEAITPAMTPEMISGHVNQASDRAPTYGFGFGTGVQPGGRTLPSHSGAFLMGAGTNFSILPSANLGIVVLTNGAPVGAAEAIANTFLDVAQFGESSRDWTVVLEPAFAPIFAPQGELVNEAPPANAASPAPLSTYTGQYRSRYFGRATVTEVDGRLQVALGPKGDYVVELNPWDGDTFVFTPHGELIPAGSKSKAVFKVAGGQAKSMTLETFDQFDLGTWTR